MSEELKVDAAEQASATTSKNEKKSEANSKPAKTVSKGQNTSSGTTKKKPVAKTNGQRAGSGGAESSAKPEGKVASIDNFEDMAAIASDATSKAADTAKNAAEQVSQTARQAYSRTAEAAKRAKEAAMTAGAQAAEKAEQNQARAEDELASEEAPDSSKQFIAQEWRNFLFNHKRTVMYGLTGLVVGILILIIGFWPVLLVVATTYIGILYGRYRDGDARVTSFLAEHFLDED